MNYSELNEFLNVAMDFADRIAIKYKELKTMEISGLKGTPLYKQVFLELKNYIDKENKLYCSIDLDDESINYLISLICSKEDIDVNQSLERLMHSDDKRFIPALRVAFKLGDFIEYDFQSIEMFVDLRELDKHIKFQKNLLKNYYLVLESFISRYLYYSNTNKDLILHIKYLLPFINSNVEKEFCNNLDFKGELLLDYTLFGDFFGMSKGIQEQYIYLHLFNKFVDEVNDLLEIDDHDFDERLDDIIVSEIILKSISMFFDEDLLIRILDDLNEHIVQNGLLYLNNRRIIGNILNLSDITKKDKANYSYLSLRLPK